tara:strand:- start:96 stop:698 length:603 start_codon:yes stop_codon:yes gene_type:complete
MNDLKSISQLSSGQYADRGSKFYSFIYPLDSISDYKDLIRKYKDENPKACHVCSAYRIYLNKWIDEYATDDGEPKGSSGLPILNVIKRNKLVNVAIYVVRIYGGVNLGIPGLINAYSTCSENAVKNSALIDWEPVEKICIQYSYDSHKLITSILKKNDGKVVKEDFKDQIISHIIIREGSRDTLMKLLNEKTSGKVLILK